MKAPSSHPGLAHSCAEQHARVCLRTYVFLSVSLPPAFLTTPISFSFLEQVPPTLLSPGLTLLLTPALAPSNTGCFNILCTWKEKEIEVASHELSFLLFSFKGGMS